MLFVICIIVMAFACYMHSVKGFLLGAALMGIIWLFPKYVENGANAGVDAVTHQVKEAAAKAK
jgi:hypothetical protein